jgi:hypothetical protein
MKKLEADLVLVFDTAREYFERTGRDFYKLRPTDARKELENYQEDHGKTEGCNPRITCE